MKYTKPPLTIEQQIQKLKERGLYFHSEEKAVSFLSNISYYRLRAYTFPFQDNSAEHQPFIHTISFDEIIQFYIFDRKLRLLVFDALEKIEIALRTQIIYQYAIAHGSHWQCNSSLFRNQNYFDVHTKSLNQEIERSHEVFIEHYKIKYTDPTELPSWMAFEVSGLGLLSKIFANLADGIPKRNITTYFGLNDFTVLENWMQCFSNIRNICAHHGRLWNRRFTAKPKLPSNAQHTFIYNFNIDKNKLYPVLCCMVYLLNIISPENNFVLKFIELINRYPNISLHLMGFPKSWKREKLWKIIKIH
jgi:abortive infection bacteriophage resistance protein